MKYFVMILVSITMISLFQFAQAREIGPFIFGLDEQEGDWIEYSDSTMTDYYGIVKQGSAINLPLKIGAGDKSTPLEFHATIGDQTGSVILPRGIQVEIQPKSFLMESNQDVTLNIFITAEKNAPSNVYSIGIVGVWPEPINNFTGTSIKIHVGRDFGPNAVPDNFYPPPLKQTKEGLLPSEVVCTNDYVLILKNNGNPACVKPETKTKLIVRGWTTTESSKDKILTLTERLQKAKSILVVSMSELKITAIGIDDLNKVLDITIHDEELERIPNAKEYYEKKIKEMIPFEVPIRIGFERVTSINQLP